MAGGGRAFLRLWDLFTMLIVGTVFRPLALNYSRLTAGTASGAARAFFILLYLLLLFVGGAFAPLPQPHM